jgi:hypothetical protein
MSRIFIISKRPPTLDRSHDAGATGVSGYHTVPMLSHAVAATALAHKPPVRVSQMVDDVFGEARDSVYNASSPKTEAAKRRKR